MTDKQKNLVIRSITGVLFVACMVSCFLNPRAMVFLFALITGLSIWEYCGLVNQKEDIYVNRFITTVAGVYFFLAVAGFRTGIVSNFVVFVPYLLTIVYLFIAELYTGNKNAINDWAYTMLSQMYIALPFSMINVLAFRGAGDAVIYNYLLPLSIFIFLWTNDTGAYLSARVLPHGKACNQGEEKNHCLGTQKACHYGRNEYHTCNGTGYEIFHFVTHSLKEGLVIY